MALISDETVLEVKRSVDITEVITSYLPLKRAGANYKGLCPFHEEKTPSFNVHPEKQIFKCFGCGKAGDAISFVMAYEKVDYPDAIKILADRAGIPVKYSGGSEAGPGRDEVYRANEWAAGVFRGLLRKAPEGEAARKFLVRRGVNEEASELFGLGFSMDSWDYLLQRARRNGTGDKVLVAAGLAVPRDGKAGCYDRFRGRLVFPIGDARGKTIAFGARTLGDDHPKFINSPETAVFSKGRGFYGLHLAKEEWEKTRTAYIVEGYLDVIVPHQAGVRGLVATLGTALTRDHLKILRRYVDRVVLVFDADAAGQKASERGLDLLLSENVDIFVAELPPGMDPDDVVLKEGPERLRACLDKPREIFDFLLASLTAKHGVETPAGKARIVEEILERLSQIPNEIKREILLQQLAARFALDERTLRGKLARQEEKPAAEAPPVPVGPEMAARELLAYVWAVPAAALRVRERLAAPDYPSPVTRRIAEVTYARLDAAGAVRADDLLGLLAQEPAVHQVAAEIRGLHVDPAAAGDWVDKTLARLEDARSTTETKDLRARFKGATPEQEDDLLRRVQAVKGARGKR